VITVTADTALGDADGPVTVTIAGREAFSALRDEWNGLCARMEYSTPFATWEWADCWLQTIGRDATLQIVVARRAGCAVGILPLAKRLSGNWLPVFTMLGTERLYPDHIALIAASEASDTLLASLLRAAMQAGGGLARIDLPLVAEGSGMDRACVNAGLLSQMRTAGIAPYIPINGSYEEFLAGLSGNERYKIRNRTKKLLAMPGVRFGGVAASEYQTVLRRLRELHGSRAAQKGIKSSFDLDDVQEFHTRLIDALPAGTVTFRCLWSGDEIFAVFYGFTLQGRVFYFQLGYDPAWADRSPGIVLLSEVIREAHMQGCAEFNFLQGDEPFKWTWTRKKRTLNNWAFYRPGVAGAARRTVEIAMLRSKAIIKRLLLPISPSADHVAPKAP
jgi:CelD/BcsL family acetyltransferase involved in cellulose biosynthesis